MSRSSVTSKTPSLFGDEAVDDGPAEFGAEGALSVRVPVLLPVALDAVYDYRLPSHIQVEPGCFVMVPFGPQERIGIVWDKPDEGAAPVPEKKIKPILARLDVPPLPLISLRFAEWVARYTLNTRGMVARMMMSATEAFETPKPRFGVRMVGAAPVRLTPGRQRVVDVACDGQIRSKQQLAAEANASTAVIDGLVVAGTLVQVELPEKRLANPNPAHMKVAFNDQQAQAVHMLQAAIDGRVFSVSLLDGVTGSGKTEVYFEAIARALESDPDAQVMVLLPEIALTGQFIERFEQRFGVKPVEWHSAVSPVDRGRIWKAASTGEARVIIGARSALFLPFRHLGLIIVDEEHDPGFKQEDRVFYQGRDMAVVRARLGNIPIVLASATPSIETHWNTRSGRYRHVHLAHRFSGSELPNVQPIDLRKAPPEKGKWLSPVLVEAVTEAIGRGEQALLFLNRRGYAPLTLCRGCGHRMDCPQCTAWLVEHRFRHRLSCHHCGFSLPIPEGCPKCGEVGGLVPCGPGVERIAEEVTARWPDSKQAILSSDLIPGITELREILRTIIDGEAQIIVGTQIVAKGHNFSKLQLVGVVDGDLGLAGSDPRAGERTFQLLHQVTGRAGRVIGGGRGFVQTHNPDHPVMEAIIAGDRELFIEREIASRQAGMLPPFGRLASLIISARDKEQAVEFARQVALHAPEAKRIEVLGPAEAPISVVRGRHRYRLLVKAPREIDIQSYLRAWLDAMPKIKGDIRLTVDIDPYNFL
jgi:primosomal protein N' (replication factor Y) (superfamily II helicase)